MLAAFTLGFFGSFHCIGMCGPIAASLPGAQQRFTPFLISRLFYNSGRLFTYMILGLLAGMAGYGAKFFLVQQYFSLALGVIVLLWSLRELGWLPGVKRKKAAVMPLRNWVAKWFSRGTWPGMFGIGLANGLLPCGFVYMAIFLAALSGSPGEGALTMAAFGLATFPAMLIVSFSLRAFATQMSRFVTRMVPYSMLLIGSLFVLRGMALGIPYVSPKWEGDTVNGKPACCVVKVEKQP